MTVSRPVVSADDVRAAHRKRAHRLPIPRGAIVTPLARDEADRWGIELVEEAVGGGENEATGSITSRRHVPTCDPDDLDRVVERVRRQVPDADPSVVREVAQRVLQRLGGS